MKRKKLVGAVSALLVLFFAGCDQSAEKHIQRTGSNVSIQLINSHRGLTIEYDLNDFGLDEAQKNGATYSVIKMSGSLKTKDKGFAEIPYTSTSILLPNNKNVALKIEKSDHYTDYELAYPLMPSRGVIYRNQNPSQIPYEIAADSLVESWYPGNLASVTDPYILRDVRGVNIYFYPFQYQAKSQVLRVYHSLTIKVVETDQASVNPMTKGIKDRHVLPLMNKIYGTVFSNYTMNGFSLKVSETKHSGDILVVTTERDREAMQPYIEWKAQRGFTVYERVVAKGSNVKRLIREEYESNQDLLYVQLVGDWDDVKSDLGPSNAPTDPMLGCVSGNDYYPDLIIGRFSGQKPEDISVQVQKTIYYEKYPEQDGDWYSKGLGIASSEGGGMGDDDEADYEHMAVIKDYKLLEKGYSSVAEAYKYPSTAEVSDVINSGVGVINYVGHGSSTGWVTSDYSISDIYRATNGHRLPFIFSVACVNGAFHNRSETFAEAFLKYDGGGAIGVLMSTINQPWTPPMRGQDYMNDLLIGGYDYSSNPGEGTSTTEGRRTFGGITFNGMILMYAESSYDDDLDTLKTWTLFGDASLEVRTEAPEKVYLTDQASLAGYVYELELRSEQNNIEGAIVALTQRGKTYSGITDKNGRVSINHGLEKGAAKLVITGHNLEPIVEEITIY